jgi:hypothetical protein
MKRFVILLAVLGGSGCNDDAVEGGRGFVPDAGTGAGISLEPSGNDDGDLTLDVVATDVPDLYGLAFRIHYDAAVLRHRGFEAGSDWPAARIGQAREPAAGELWAVVGAKGSFEGLPGGRRVAARFSWDRLTDAPTDVQFVPGRVRALGAAGSPIAELRWRGGRLE